MARRRRRRLSSQIFAFQALILVGTLCVGVLLALYGEQKRLDREYEHRALGVAETVATMPQIRKAVGRRDRTGVVEQLAESVRRATGVTFVVVGDRHGIRYSHPDRSKIGKRVSTDPSEALRGTPVLAVERGTLGRSARAKVPLRGSDGQIIGFVSVGVLEQKIHDALIDAIPVIALYALVALGFGLVAALLLSRRLKRQTFGLEIGEIVDLLKEREAMLHGIREGVVGVDSHGRISVVNDEARRLLDLPRDVVGRPIAAVVGEGRLDDLLAGRLTGSDLLVLAGDHVLVANRVPVRLDGRDLGAIVTLRDRTELEGLVRELDSVRSLTDAMRAQAHEFSNRLHTISGLLQLGHYEEATSLIKEIAHADIALKQALADRIADPVVAALVLAKFAVAHERDVELALAPDTRLDRELRDPRAVLTVLGNLIDNALDAAAVGDAEPPRIELLIEAVREELHIRVSDSGPGIPEAARTEIFEPGYSTKDRVGPGARGVGLSLVKRLLDRRGGTVVVGDAAGGGAVFDVLLPVRFRPDGGESWERWQSGREETLTP
jgi:two-component system CitB family sensor kinase